MLNSTEFFENEIQQNPVINEGNIIEFKITVGDSQDLLSDIVDITCSHGSHSECTHSSGG